MKSTKRLLLTAVFGACLSGSLHYPSSAQTYTQHACLATPGHAPCPSCRSSAELTRAGHPNQISRLAVLSNGRGYAGYQVGGSTPFRRAGTARSTEQGVWGWDYWGMKFKRHIALRWLNGSDAKRKFGQYTTDGPKFREQFRLHHGE